MWAVLSGGETIAIDWAELLAKWRDFYRVALDQVIAGAPALLGVQARETLVTAAG